ncbi:MAG: CDP-glycerol glycerophosphotransferase family protein [Chitinophagaceae bacterium]
MGFFSEYKQIGRLLQRKQELVFYAESRHYYPYFEKLVYDLRTAKKAIYYITSDAADPLLSKSLPGMKVIYVKWLLGYLFARLKTDVLVMTMPGLGNYLFKRSAGVGTYVYLFHAAVSTHQQYERDAFINYDAVFCTGDYQVDEMRKTEELYGYLPKNLIPYGYPLLDAIEKRTRDIPVEPALQQTILVAPSWFKGCIFDTCIEKLLQQLSKLPYKVILRSHPEYEKRKGKEFHAIKRMVEQHPNMSIDTLPNVLDRIPGCDLLVTDRSGIALEFAFGVGKPVLFIDTAFKEMNKAWRDVAIEPLENSIREELGIQVLPSALKDIPAAIKELEGWQPGFAQKMNQLKKTLFYNSPASYETGLEFILGKLKG